MDPRHEIDDLGEEGYANDAEVPIRAMLDELKPQLVRADRELRSFIRKNPLASMATVTLAGFLLGRLLRHR